MWKILAGVSDWPHQGSDYVDQSGDPTLVQGKPYGDTTRQFLDGMTYIGNYSGTSDVFFSDVPISGTPYTGQTYGIYPLGWMDANGNDVSGQIAYNPNGTPPVAFEMPIGPPVNPATGAYDYQAQAQSIEHPTVGDWPAGYLPAPVPPGNSEITMRDALDVQITSARTGRLGRRR